MNESFRPLTIRPGWVVPAALAVLLWRVLAYVWPSSMITIPAGLGLPLTLLGLVFLASGLWVWWVRPNRWTTVFLLYALGGAVHWGGAIGAPRPSVELTLLFAYLAPTVMSDAAFLHLALAYPGERRLAGWRYLLYAPAAVAMLFSVGAAFMPPSVLQTAIGVLLMTDLLAIAGAIVFLVRTIRAGREVRRAARLQWILAGVFLGGGVAQLGAARVLPGEPDAWNLALGLIPIALAFALVTTPLEPSDRAVEVQT